MADKIGIGNLGGMLDGAGKKAEQLKGKLKETMSTLGEIESLTAGVANGYEAQIKRYAEQVSKLKGHGFYVDEDIDKLIADGSKATGEKAKEAIDKIEEALSKVADEYVDILYEELHVDEARSTIKAAVSDLLADIKSTSKYGRKGGDTGGHYEELRKRNDAIESGVGRHTELKNKGVDVSNLIHLFGGTVSGSTSKKYIEAATADANEQLLLLKQQYADLMGRASELGISAADVYQLPEVIDTIERQVIQMKRLGKTDAEILSPFNSGMAEDEHARNAYMDAINAASGVRTIADEMQTELRGIVDLYDDIEALKQLIEKRSEYIRLLNAQDSELTFELAGADNNTKQQMADVHSMGPDEWYARYIEAAARASENGIWAGTDATVTELEVANGAIGFTEEEIKNRVIESVAGVNIQKIVEDTVSKAKEKYSYAYKEGELESLTENIADIKGARADLDRFNKAAEVAIQMSKPLLTEQRTASGDVKLRKDTEYAGFTNDMLMAKVDIEDTLKRLNSGSFDTDDLEFGYKAIETASSKLSAAYKELSGTYIESIEADTESNAYVSLVKMKETIEELKNVLREIGTLSISDEKLAEMNATGAAKKYLRTKEKEENAHRNIVATSPGEKTKYEELIEKNGLKEIAATLAMFKRFPDLERSYKPAVVEGYKVKLKEATDIIDKLSEHSVDTSDMTSLTPEYTQSQAETYAKLVWKELLSALMTAKGSEKYAVYEKYEDELKGLGKHTSELDKIASLRLKDIETFFARIELKTGRETSNSVKARYYSSHIGDFAEGSDAQLKVAKLAKDARIAAIKEEESAMKATEAERARILKERQDAEKAAAKAAEDAAKAAADAEARRITDSLDEVKNYVKKKRDLEGEDLSYGEQASYYDSQLSRFEKGSKEYEEVLMLRNIAERKAIAETKSNFTKLANTLTTIGSKITNFVNGIVNAIQNVVSFVKTTFSILKSVFVKIGSGVSGIIKLFGNLGNRVRSIFGGANKDIKGTALTLEQFKRSATELRSKIELLKSAFNAVFNNKYIDQATELYMSVYSMKNIMGGELTQETIDWAKSMERAFGVSAKSMIADMNELTGVLYGLGMAADDVAIGSQNILMMSRYLAMFGAAGGSVDEVKNKLLSGLKGMTASIDDLGLSVREAQMQQFLDDLAKQGKIAKVSWQNLNEEQRIYIRYASLIDQYTSKYDITQYAKALNTVTGRITLLKERVKSLAYNVAQIFIVFASKLANFVSYAVSLLDGLVTNLASKLGFSTEMSESMNEMFGDTGIDDTTSSLEGMNSELEKAKENANKASNALASFDKLEGFTAGSNDSSDTDNLDFSFLMADSLAKMNELAKNSPDFTETLKAEFDATLEHWKNSINNFFKEWNGRDLDLGFDWPTIESELKTILSNIGNILGNIGTFIVDIGLNIADDIKLGRLITDLTVLISKFTTLADKVTKVAHPAFKAFYEQALKPVNKFIGEHLSKTIRTVADEFKNWSDWVSTNGGLIVQFFDAVGRVVGAVWAVFEPYFNATWGRLIGWITDFGDELRKAFSEGMVSYIANVNGKMQEATTTAEKLVAAFTGNYNSDGSGSLFDKILQTVSELVKALKILWSECIVPLGKELKDVFVNQILPDILEMIRELAGWIQEHSGDIKNFIMEMLPYLWKILKLVLEVVGKIMGYLIEHPGEVKGFINLLIALQGFKIAGSVLSSLGTFLTTLEKIATVLGIIEKKQFVDFATGEVVTKVGAGKLGTKALSGLKAIGGGSAAVGTVAATGYLAGGIQAGRGLYDVYKGTKEGDNERKNKGAGTVATVGSFAVTGAALGSTVFPGLGTVAGGGIGALVGALSSWLGDDFMDEIGKLLTETIPNAVIGVVKGIHNFTVEKAEAAAKYITDKFKGFGDKIKTANETLLTNTSEVFTGMKDKVSTFFTETLPKAHGMLLGYVEKGLDAVLPDSINNISGTVNKLFTGLCNGVNELWNKVTGFYNNSIRPAMNNLKNGVNTFLNSEIVNKIGDVWRKIASFITQYLPDSLKNIGNAIKTLFTVTIPNAFKNFFSNIGSKVLDYIKGTNANISAGYTAITGKEPTKTRTISNPVTPIASIKGNALGGVPKSGSLFFANENGNHELIGNFGGYTGVANQGMIVDAIKQAVYEAMVAAGTATSRTTDVLRDMNINIGSNGFNIYDKSTLRQFAREIIAEIYEILRNENNPGFVLI